MRQSIHIEEERRRLQAVMSELAHSLSHVAEALAHTDHRERDPHIRHALNHIEYAAVNLTAFGITADR